MHCCGLRVDEIHLDAYRIRSMENEPSVDDNRAGWREEDQNWEISSEQSSDWESQGHHEPKPTPSWSPCLAIPNRIEQTAIYIEDVEDCPSDDRQTYCVTFFGDQIRTTLTNTASVVDDWIADIRRIHHHRIDQSSSSWV
ncbi:hypothetical protein NE237_013932 [Protea cynaroides]|uniref:Uncharacterized protein n=1 Tax=Protea cynaroides TaxID=273540 RepID=A0A9Q0H0U2_9MAGN|nr:hypothetical protein NE237_013932 [Protea cynaroides]